MTTDDSAEEPTQISVAELLARNGRKNGVASSESGGRRRRGVAGGITVAELTGELPVVTRAEPEVEQAKAPEPEPQPRPEPEPEPKPEPKPEPEPQPKQQTPPRPTAWSSQREPELLAGSPTSSGLLGGREPERPGESTEVIGAFGSTRAPVERSWMNRRPDAEPDQPDEPDTDHVEVEKSHDFGWTRTPKDEAPRDEAPKAEWPDKDALATTERADDTELDAEKLQAQNKTNARQWLVLAGQAVAAIVVGALLFKGFERLWDMLPWVALVLAVLVILGLVALVRILRKTDDLLSIVIAIVVGVFVTMGPLVFLLSTS